MIRSDLWIIVAFVKQSLYKGRPTPRVWMLPTTIKVQCLLIRERRSSPEACFLIQYKYYINKSIKYK